MNRKLLMGVVAGGAALAIAAGGSTYAGLSDFATVTGNDTGAGTLVLNIAGGNGIEAAQGVSYGNFAPGQHSEHTRYLLSQQGDAVPAADLYVTMKSLVNKDNGCSSASESHVDSNCVNETDSGGEFGQYANIKIVASDATTDSNCGHTAYVNTVYDGTINSLSAAGQQTIATGLSDGYGVCVKVTVSMPYSSADQNAVQGDSATWDWRYDLVQETPAP